MNTFARDITKVLGATFGLFIIGPFVAFWACGIAQSLTGGGFPTLLAVVNVLGVGPVLGWKLGGAAVKRYNIGQ